MKLLLDECTPRRIRREFVGHDVHTVEDAGFKGLENGDLLKAASGVYEVLITVDRNIPYQQRITNLPIAILILVAKRNKYEHLKPLIPRALQALETIRPGQMVEIATLN